MNHRQSGNAASVLQVTVVDADLCGQELTLIDHGARRARTDIELFAVLEMQIRNGNGGALADDVELALERVGHQHIRAVADEHLANDRLFFANDGRHGHGTVNRHVTPAENHLAFGRNSAFNFLFAGMT